MLTAHGRIDGLFNNAGGQFPSPLRDISLKGWEAVVRNNLTGGFLVARECYTQWMEANGGAIVNIIADMWNGMPGMGHSGAARAGMLSFTETAACEWAASGVRVNAVAPGWIASSGFDTYPPAFQEKIRQLGRKVPLQRLGTEAEVSAAVVFLLSPQPRSSLARPCAWMAACPMPSTRGRCPRTSAPNHSTAFRSTSCRIAWHLPRSKPTMPANMVLQPPNPRYYTAEHEAFRASVRRFFDKEVAPHAEAWDEAGGFPRELYRKAAEAGLLQPGFPEAYGGAPCDAFTA